MENKNLEGRFFCNEEQLIGYKEKHKDGYKGTHYWIYAFIVDDPRCPKLKKYIKIGFTQQYPIDRLNEWKKTYENLRLVGIWETSFVKDGQIFYLFDDKIFKEIKRGYRGIKRINKEERDLISVEYNMAISDEFFFDEGFHDVAISVVSNIISNYIDNCEKGIIANANVANTVKDMNRIQYKDFELNRLQNDRLNRMVDSLNNKGILKLLFPAIMRFGKTTVMEELIRLQKYGLSLVLCGEDTSSSWIDDIFNKRFIEDGKEGFPEEKKNHFALFTFDGPHHLRAYGDFYNNGVAYRCFGEKITYEYGFIKSILSDPNNHVIFYISLQDGMKIDIKEKHKELSEICADLMIIDETHFAARGKECREAISKFNHKTEIHLSATPYNILKGNEFSPEQIIEPVYYEDMIAERDYWYSENFHRPEYENPLFAFPDIKFYTMTNGFIDPITNKPVNVNNVFKTIEKDGKTVFENKEQAVAMIECMFGKPGTDGGFISNKYAENVNALKHGYIVFDETSSCYAFKDLFEEMYPIDRFEIIIASGTTPDEAAKSVMALRNALSVRDTNADKSEMYKSGRSLTLTCKRFMCGVTVPYWDFGILWANIDSMETYNQIWGRLLSRFVEEHIVEDENGNPKKILISRKNNVCFFDLNFERVSRMSVNQLRFSASRRRAHGESISEEELYTITVCDLDNSFREVEYSEMVSKRNESFKKDSIDELMSKITLATLPYSEEYDFYQDFEGKKGYNYNPKKQNKKPENEDGNGNAKEVEGKVVKKTGCAKYEKEDIKVISEEARRSAYGNILRLCLVEYCLNNGMRINSLKHLIEICERDKNVRKHAEEFGLQLEYLYLIDKMREKFYQATYELMELDDNIYGMLSYMDSLNNPYEKSRVFLKYFGRISENEVITPDEIVDAMLEYSGFKPGNTVIEIGSKCCEFLLGIVKNYGIEAARNVTVMPSSKASRMITIGIFNLLGLDNKKIFPYNSNECVDLNNKRINKVFVKENSMKKFDIAVGNPPYQLETKNTSDNPIYHMFMDLGFDIANIACFITPARFLSDAGKTPKKWNKKMLNDEHFKVIKHYTDASDVFKNVDIKGGVAITLRNEEKVFGKIGTYIKNETLRAIDKKVISHKDFHSMTDSIYLQDKFVLENLYKDFPEYKQIIGSNGCEKRLTSSILNQLPEVFSDVKTEEKYGVYGRSEGVGRTTKYIDKKYIEINKKNKEYGALVSTNYGTGSFGETIPSPFICKPGYCFTQTFIQIGSFKTLEEANNVIKFIKTKFVRAMIGVLKVTPSIKSEIFSHVPTQDFSDKSDIDWSVSISEIDAQLYKKYGLSEEEISFINNNVKPME